MIQQNDWKESGEDILARITRVPKDAEAVNCVSSEYIFIR